MISVLGIAETLYEEEMRMLVSVGKLCIIYGGGDERHDISAPVKKCS